MFNIKLFILLAKVLLVLLMFFFGALFLVQNLEVLNQPFSLSLSIYGTGLKWTSQEPIPYYFTLIIAFILGGLFTAGFFILDRIGLSFRLRQQKSQMNKTVHVLEEEITRLRTEKKQLSDDLELAKRKLPKEQNLEEKDQKASM